MFEVLVFVYENYWRGNDCPEATQLGRKLSAHGFEAEEIREALDWLEGLSLATQGIELTRPVGEPTVAIVASAEPLLEASADAMRVYSQVEQAHLGAECLGFICFLENAGWLSPKLREVVIDRAMAAPGDPVALGDLKIILLMVHWSAGVEPDALVLDELCDSREGRVAH